MAILVSTTNVHKDEVRDLKEYLDKKCWKVSEISAEEIQGILDIINYIILKRKNDDASNLSYMELINLKNKL